MSEIVTAKGVRDELIVIRMLRDIVDAQGRVSLTKGDLVEMTRTHVEDNLIPFGFCEIVTP